MNLDIIKSRLENKYFIGFSAKKTDDGFVLTLSDSDDDKFAIKIALSNQVRLSAEASIEKYGASFLHLISKSSKNKRQNFVDIANKNTQGHLELKINKNNIELSDFVDLLGEWKDFSIRFTEFPFEENEDEIVRVLCLIMGMMLSLFEYSIEGFEEGEKQEILSEKYERNPINRQICLAYKGYKCCICGFDFSEYYGDVGKETIEVHHTKPVSEMEPGHIVKPLEELVPVCSNCHTIIHKRKVPYSVDEVRAMLKSNDSP